MPPALQPDTTVSITHKTKSESLLLQSNVVLCSKYTCKDMRERRVKVESYLTDYRNLKRSHGGDHSAAETISDTLDYSRGRQKERHKNCSR